jgi:malto-oligosyltrehalose trehalohydrolase
LDTLSTRRSSELEGTFAAVIPRIEALRDLGITAIELMPVGQFPGTRGWGYDGVLPFAPQHSYGGPEGLKRLVEACHRAGLAIFLDVVYNHFGPEGNYLPSYAPQFFNPAHQTPWGAAINFDGEHNAAVRSFFVHNALYWIEEFHLDGLRMDAVHAIADDSPRHIVHEIAEAIAGGPGLERHVHLVLENDANLARLLERDRPAAVAQWNDDSHHAFHVLATGETDGYYQDYADRPAWQLGRTLSEGFAYQGDSSKLRHGEKRGEPSRHLPHEAFINFIQNHDQVGNRALGERIAALAPAPALKLASAAYLLAPTIPMLFMGEEFGAATPFLFFCDFHGQLADAVREGRRKEFAAFAKFADPATREKIPDPNAVETFQASRLDWDCLAQPSHAAWLDHYRRLIALRRLKIVPRLDGKARASSFRAVGREGVEADWVFGDGTRLNFRGNFSNGPREGYTPVPGASILHAENGAGAEGPLPPWGGLWMIATP